MIKVNQGQGWGSIRSLPPPAGLEPQGRQYCFLSPLLLSLAMPDIWYILQKRINCCLIELIPLLKGHLSLGFQLFQFWIKLPALDNQSNIFFLAWAMSIFRNNLLSDKATCLIRFRHFPCGWYLKTQVPLLILLEEYRVHAFGWIIRAWHFELLCSTEYIHLCAPQNLCDIEACSIWDKVLMRKSFSHW